MQRRRDFVGLIVCLLIAFATGAVGAVASVRAAEFYVSLTRPGWAPPAGVFGPVWTALYFLMGIASWIVWRKQAPRTRHALTLYLAQLVANALWSWLFFAWHQGAWAFGEILLLWALIVATLVSFWRIRPLAGALLLPYLAWVSFAAVLAFTVWRLNPKLLG